MYEWSQSEYGSNADSYIMTHSRLYHKFVTDNYRPFPGAVLLADSAYEGYHDWMVNIFIYYLTCLASTVPIGD